MAINLRYIGKELHQALKVRAATEDVTIESLCVRFLWQGLDQRAGGSERIGRHMGPNPGQDLDSGQVTGSAKPDMQALRDICAGRGIGEATSSSNEHELPVEVPICGKDWWEDGEHYECLMDAGHREQKHGMRGMVRVIS